jgi:hypothetical protein
MGASCGLKSAGRFLLQADLVFGAQIPPHFAWQFRRKTLVLADLKAT